MERIWLKGYPAGVPADIDPKKYRSLIELFEQSIAKYRDRPAFHSMGKSITFDQLDASAKAPCTRTMFWIGCAGAAAAAAPEADSMIATAPCARRRVAWRALIFIYALP